MSSRHNEVHYEPSREEIEARCEALLWMKAMDWEVELMDSIFLYDNPTLDMVRRTVYKLGPEKARILFLSFLD